MNGLQTFSIRETRAQLSDIINQVSVANRSFVITKFGKPKAMVTPLVPAFKKNTKALKGIAMTAGAWKHRTDIKDSAKWVANLRHKMSSRYGSIFS